MFPANGRNSRGSEPTVSVVIPHKGPSETLERCLTSLRNQAFDPSDYEVIVVINEAPNLGAHHKVASNHHVLWCEDYFSYAARNMGISRSNGEIIAFIDSDAIAEPNWLSEGVRHIKGGSDIVAGQVELFFEKRPLTAAACYEKLYAFDQPKNLNAGRAPTVNLFVRRETFYSCGPFDERAESGEDFRWTSAAIQAGHKLAFAPSALVNHPARETLQEVLLKAYRVSRGYLSSVPRDSPSPLSTLWSRGSAGLRPSLQRRATAGLREKLLANIVLVAVVATKLGVVAQAMWTRAKVRK